MGVRVYEDKLVHVGDFLGIVTILEDPIEEFKGWTQWEHQGPTQPWDSNGFITYFAFILRLYCLPEQVFVGARWEAYDTLKSIMQRDESPSDILALAESLIGPHLLQYDWATAFGYICTDIVSSMFIGSRLSEKIMARHFDGCAQKIGMDEEIETLKAAGIEAVCTRSPGTVYLSIAECIAYLECVPQCFLRFPREKLVATCRFHAEHISGQSGSCFRCDQSADQKLELKLARKAINTLHQKLRTLRDCLQ